MARDYVKLIEDWLDALGIAKDDVLDRLRMLQVKYPDQEVPISDVRNVLLDFVTEDKVKDFLMNVVAPEFVTLLQTGRSRVTQDPSALA